MYRVHANRGAVKTVAPDEAQPAADLARAKAILADPCSTDDEKFAALDAIFSRYVLQ